MIVALAGIVLGLAGTTMGLQCWRGEEMSAVAEYQRRHGPTASPFPLLGGYRLYQSYLGGTYLAALGGAGFIVIGLAEITRGITGQPKEWWAMYVFGYSGGALIALSALFTLAYFWVGVPDWMRPPAQRGWRLTKHGYELVRPEAVPPHLREPQRREQERW